MRRLTASLCIAATTIASVAYAEESTDEKRGHALWRAGVRQYDLGDFDGAIQKYEDAYKLAPNPDILFNLGQAYRQKKNYERAVHFFRTYLRNKPNASNQKVVSDLIAELDGLIAAQKASNQKPPDTIAQPAPGPAATPPPVVPTPAAAPASSGTGSRWYQDPLGWTLVAGGVIGIGVGTFSLLHAGSLSDQAAMEPDEQQAQKLHDSSHTFQLTGGILVGVGVALAAGGVVKMILHDKGTTESSRMAVAVGPGGVAVLGTF